VSYGDDVLDDYSVPARRVVLLAMAEARQLDHPHVGTEHLVLGLLSDEGSEAADALRAGGASLAAARHKVTELLTAEAGVTPSGDLPLTARAQRALDRAGRFSRQDREPEVRAEHVLLGVLDVEGLGCQVLRGLSVDIVQLRKSLVDTPTDAAPVIVEVADSTDGVRPRCPTCGALLDDTLVEMHVAARRPDGSPTDVSVMCCEACGTALGVLRPDNS